MRLVIYILFLHTTFFFFLYTDDLEKYLFPRWWISRYIFFPCVIVVARAYNNNISGDRVLFIILK